MAVIPETMDENRISFLANEIAKTYMTDKIGIGGTQEFIETYLDVYEAAKKIVTEREQTKQSTMGNFNNFPEDFPEDVEDKTTLSSFFR